MNEWQGHSEREGLGEIKLCCITSFMHVCRGFRNRGILTGHFPYRMTLISANMVLCNKYILT